MKFFIGFVKQITIFLFFSVYCNFAFAEIDPNLSNNAGYEKKVLKQPVGFTEKEIKQVKSKQPDNERKNEVSGSSFEGQNNRIKKNNDTPISAFNEQQINKMSSSLDAKYGDHFNDKIIIDNSLRRTRGNKRKIDIKVSDTKNTRIGSVSIGIKEAYNCFINKDYELALYHYQNVLAQNKDNPEAMFGMGVCYQLLLQYDQAIEMYMKLIKNNYSRRKVVGNLLIAVRHKPDNEALEILNSIEEKSAGYADVLSQIGVIYMKQNDYNKAIFTLSKANEIAPDNALIAYNLALSYDRQNNQDYAKHFYEQAIRNDIADIISPDDMDKVYKRLQQIDDEIMENMKKKNV